MQARQLLGFFYDTMTEGADSIEKKKDQTRGAIRPLPHGHKVANHQMAQVRHDIAQIEENYQLLVATAFGIDRNSLFSTQARYTSQMVATEKFTLHTVNKTRKQLGEALTRVYIESRILPMALKNVKVKDYESDPDIAKKMAPRVEILPTPTMTFDELCKYQACGFLDFEKDAKPLAEALVGMELHGTGKVKILPGLTMAGAGTESSTGSSSSSSSSSQKKK
jgi:hypothetical protein